MYRLGYIFCGAAVTSTALYFGVMEVTILLFTSLFLHEIIHKKMGSKNGK